MLPLLSPSSKRDKAGFKMLLAYNWIKKAARFVSPAGPDGWRCLMVRVVGTVTGKEGGRLGPPGHTSHAQLGHPVHLHPLLPHLSLDETSSCPLVGQVRGHGAQCTNLEMLQGSPIKCRVSVLSQRIIGLLTSSKLLLSSKFIGSFLACHMQCGGDLCIHE